MSMQQSPAAVQEMREANAMLLKPKSSKSVRDPDRTGRKAIGLYPDVNRTYLARRVKRHVSTITHVLQGRNKCNTELAAAIARALGISLDQLAADLKREQLKFVRARKQSIQRNGSGD